MADYHIALPSGEEYDIKGAPEGADPMTFLPNARTSAPAATQGEKPAWYSGLADETGEKFADAVHNAWEGVKSGFSSIPNAMSDPGLAARDVTDITSPLAVGPMMHGEAAKRGLIESGITDPQTAAVVGKGAEFASALLTPIPGAKLIGRLGKGVEEVSPELRAAADTPELQAAWETTAQKTSEAASAKAAAEEAAGKIPTAFATEEELAAGVQQVHDAFGKIVAATDASKDAQAARRALAQLTESLNAQQAQVVAAQGAQGAQYQKLARAVNRGLQLGVGALVGGAVGHPIAGAIVGFLPWERVGQLLASPTTRNLLLRVVKTPFDAKVVPVLLQEMQKNGMIEDTPPPPMRHLAEGTDPAPGVLSQAGDLAEAYVPGVHGYADAYRFLAGTPKQQQAVATEGEDQFQHPYRTAASGIGNVLLAASVPGTAEAIEKGALKALVTDEAGGVGVRLPGMGSKAAAGAASKAAGSVEPTQEMSSWMHGDFPHYTAPYSGNTPSMIRLEAEAAAKKGIPYTVPRGFEEKMALADRPDLWNPKQQLGEKMQRVVKNFRSTHAMTRADNQELTERMIKIVDKEPGGWDLMKQHYREWEGNPTGAPNPTWGGYPTRFEMDLANAAPGGTTRGLGAAAAAPTTWGAADKMMRKGSKNVTDEDLFGPEPTTTTTTTLPPPPLAGLMQ